MKSYKTLKNYQVDTIPPHLTEAAQIASFLGLSMNALYLRLHFENFPLPVKLNGKLWFDMKEVIPFLSRTDEQYAYAWLVRDEIRTLIDTAQIDRTTIGALAHAPKPAVFGGAVYNRPMSYTRATHLYDALTKASFQLYLPANDYSDAMSERIKISSALWENLITLMQKGKLDEKKIGSLLVKKGSVTVGRGIIRHGPSWRVARMLHLALLKAHLI